MTILATLLIKTLLSIVFIIVVAIVVLFFVYYWYSKGVIHFDDHAIHYKYDDLDEHEKSIS